MTVEKVKAALRNIQEFAGKHSHLDTIWNEAEAGLRALAALNGEEEDVWTAHEDGYGLWRVDGERTLIVKDCLEHHARRIASDHNRLPALERAAREVLKTFGAGPYADVGGAIYALRAALADSPDAQHEAARERRSTGE